MGGFSFPYQDLPLPSIASVSFELMLLLVFDKTVSKMWNTNLLSSFVFKALHRFLKQRHLMFEWTSRHHPAPFQYFVFCGRGNWSPQRLRIMTLLLSISKMLSCCCCFYIFTLSLWGKLGRCCYDFIHRKMKFTRGHAAYSRPQSPSLESIHKYASSAWTNRHFHQIHPNPGIQPQDHTTGIFINNVNKNKNLSINE